MPQQQTKVVAVLGNDISTDIIYPGRFMATVLPSETPQYAFADNAELNRRLKAKEIPPGSAFVAGTNLLPHSKDTISLSSRRGLREYSSRTPSTSA